MSLVSMPLELVGMPLEFNSATGKWKLPNGATDEQIKAYAEYQARCEKAQKDMVIIEE